MRIRWTEEEIAKRLASSVEDLNLTRMPTASELRQLDHGNALACAITRNGGLDHWASRLGLKPAEHASRKGWKWEDWAGDLLEGLGGMNVQRSRRVKNPWDLMVNGFSVDVKYAKCSIQSGGAQWTWRVTNKHPSDFLLLVALDAGIPRVLIVPRQLAGNTSITLRRSSPIWKYENAWHLLEAA